MSAPAGAVKERKRVGRGQSSGLGKTSGKGNKGQKARTGKGKPRAGFEGGQMPMYRRLPKRGFINVFATRYCVVNVEQIQQHFDAGEEVNLSALKSRRLATSKHQALRVLGQGDIAVQVTVTADHFSASAQEKIKAAGGTVNLVASVS
jgi:large subunit ribosomal protein L15